MATAGSITRTQTESVSLLEEILSHIEENDVPDKQAPEEQLSTVAGPTDPPLAQSTLAELLTLQSLQHHDDECMVFLQSNTRWTYGKLEDQSQQLARGLLALGVEKGDRIGIMSGNCEQYVALFFAVAKVGAILVVINNTYSSSELLFSLEHTECKLLFIVPYIARHSNVEALNRLGPYPSATQKQYPLERTVILRGTYQDFTTYDTVIAEGMDVPSSVALKREDEVRSDDVCNLQFTSGSTGNPKAAMLTHHNLVNNSRFIGDRMDLTSRDILCCPPPMFHCFGLVLGLLAVISHGAKVIYPSEVFDAPAVLRAISEEKCTALHGVPTMFEAVLNLPRSIEFDCSHLRTGIIAGAPVPRPLMERLLLELNMTEFTSSYGLTEASPTCFNAFTSDTIRNRLTTVGKILPHARGMIVNPQTGAVLPVGERGELCIAGYQIFNGYWKNPVRTKEALVRDIDGTVWLRTGDEAFFDPQGYCTITGRFKDIIIRGGENVYPLEIEERLVEHRAIAKASVVGLPDSHYGEIVAAFLTLEDGIARPGDEEVRQWVRKLLGRHKAPKHVFVFGVDKGLPAQVPQTGSGKVQKQVLRDLGKSLIQPQQSQEPIQARL